MDDFFNFLSKFLGYMGIIFGGICFLSFSLPPYEPTPRVEVDFLVFSDSKESPATVKTSFKYKEVYKIFLLCCLTLYSLSIVLNIYTRKGYEFLIMLIKSIINYIKCVFLLSDRKFLKWINQVKHLK